MRPVRPAPAAWLNVKCHAAINNVFRARRRFPEQPEQNKKKDVGENVKQGGPSSFIVSLSSWPPILSLVKVKGVRDALFRGSGTPFSLSSKSDWLNGQIANT